MFDRLRGFMAIDGDVVTQQLRSLSLSLPLSLVRKVAGRFPSRGSPRPPLFSPLAASTPRARALIETDGTWRASRFNKTRTHGTVAPAAVIDA
jgi:hypothetical protein